jgi:integrase/recombinase XerD
MMRYHEPLRLPSEADAPPADPVRLAASAYLARFTGSSRQHTESDLRCYLRWCADRGLDPLAARRPDLEQYIRWMQEACRFKPSTISRRFSVAAGFYRTCVIDAVLEHSPADHVRRPNVPAESPTLGFTHLQFEALLTAARESASDYDFALVAMLGLPGLRIFEATGADIADLGEEHGHRVLRVCGKGTKIVLAPLPRPSAGPSTAPPRAAPAGRSCSTAAAPGWTGTPPPAACATSPGTRACRSPGHIPTCSGTPS